MTLKEVAKRANVSVSTASKALKNSFDVAEETRARVQRAAHELGYFDRKKQVAIGNHGPAGWRIAVLCPEVISPFYTAAVQAICAAAESYDCKIVIYTTGFDEDECCAIIQECIEDTHIDAILSLTGVPPETFSDTVPTVLFTQQAYPPCSTVYTDLSAALRQIRQKYERTVTVAAVGEGLTSHRQSEICAHLSGYGVVGRGRYEEAGTDAAKQLLARPALPDLIVCTYDEIAYGLIAHLTANGVAIPATVEVIAINDSFASRWVHGGVSAVAFDYGTVFSDVIRDMVQDLNQKSVTTRRYRVTTHFIERNTTK